ncbi:HNH endonuclease [Delftia sp. ZNC0008]|uniref:HNH endonuclease n=1 Tax=Delftia sp. ZNC0008 TaxID=1339242 RepID=UPI0012E06054|nr:HNH endonuclease [Delftia sp. ZNC0008]
MRDPQPFWTDHKGRTWPVVRSSRRLKFKYPAHAALRAFVFHRDGYACVRCGVKAVNVPADYDGAEALRTNSQLSSGWPDMLVADHVLTLRAGGTSTIQNLQTLCETCNRRKQKEDRSAFEAYREKEASK